MSLAWFFYFFLALVASWVLLSSPYHRNTNLGWFVAIWWLPFLGALVYLLTIVRARRRGMNYEFSKLINVQKELNDSRCIMEVLGKEYDFLNYEEITSAELLEDECFIDRLISLIDEASERIWLTTYIFSGTTKTEVLHRLVDAHNRGVDVRVMVDRIGSSLLFRSTIQAPGGGNLPFPVSIFHGSRVKSLFFIEKRLHTKIALIDGRSIVGSHNIRDEINSKAEAGVSNLSLMFSGPVVKQVEAVYKDLWYQNTSNKINYSFVLPEAVDCSSSMVARAVFSDPIERPHNYGHYLDLLLSSAKRRILIWAPYVIPSQPLRATLISSCKLGVEVKVLIPEKADSLLVDNAHALIVKELADAGISCVTGQGIFDHSKLLVVDDIVMIGSANFDYRSIYRNYETNIEIYSEEFTNNIAQRFKQKCSEALNYKTDNYKKDNYKAKEVPVIKHIFRQFTSLIAGLY